MSYIGNEPTSVAFLTDTFSGNGSTTAFTMSAAPATTTSILVAVTGVLQDPSTYSVVGTTLTFSAAPPSGTGNISVRYLGIPASGVTTTAYRTITEFTATAGQTTFTPPSYTPGYINVYRNGVMLGTADYTASNGTTVVLATGAISGDLITTESFYVSSVLNAIPATAGSVITTYLADSSVTTAKIATGNITPTQLNTQAQYTGFKNRIINGDMRIDQRNNGASVTPTSGQYLVDRFRAILTQASKYSVQQNAGSVTPPAGFTNYLGVTSLSSYTLTGSDGFSIEQIIEGFNIADLGWGTANAQPATLSFLVRSSLTGTFGGSIATANGTIWVLPFTYSIPVANTWTSITISIPAGTSAVPFTNNSSGIFVRFGLGTSGALAGGTSGVWTSAGNYIQPTGTVSVVSTNGATFYITGVQLEKGTTATSFDYRPYGTELQLCQRYYFRITANVTETSFGAGYINSSTNSLIVTNFPVQMRINPTALEQSGTASNYGLRNPGGNVNCNAVPAFSNANQMSATTLYTVASGVTAGHGTISWTNNSAAYLAWSAEL